MLQKFSKSYANMWAFKENLTLDNEKMAEHQNHLYEIYKQQPECKFCKICHGTKKRWQFHSHGVLYFCCDTCGHINGNYEDTEEYCRMLYENDDGCFGSTYEDAEKERYFQRVKTIYLPKAQFMKEAFAKGGGGIEISRLKFLDIGAGTGHFVLAMQQEGLNAWGIDVDIHQVRHAQNILSPGLLEHCPSENLLEYISSTSADVITCIYAFEHITNVVEIFDAIQRNSKIRWLYFSVPMFSLASVIDSINSNDIYARILHSAHTHIYSDESIKWICNKYNWKVLGDWRFGADAADLLRTIMITAESNGDKEFAKVCRDKFVEMMDDLQHVIDKNYFCSDIHILVEKN